MPAAEHRCCHWEQLLLLLLLLLLGRSHQPVLS
jgi:hypothetical protein